MKKLWTKIKIHPITYLVVLFSLLTGLFRYLIIISSIVIIHEIGHIIMARVFKREMSSINILPFGGLIKFDSLISSNIFEDLLIAVGGVLAQLIFGIVLSVFKSHVRDYSLLYYYNTLIMGFNLIPLCPLDGYKIVKYLGELVLPFKRTFYYSFTISMGILLGLFFGKVDLVRDNLLCFMFIAYMSINEFINKRYVLNRFYLERMIYDFDYRLVHIDNISKMYKNKVHIINGVDEKSALRVKYECKSR